MLAEKDIQPRRVARTFALQALYELDLTSHSAEAVAGWLQEETAIGQEALDYAQELVKGVLENVDALDKVIHQFAPSWPVRYLSAIDRNVLRLALYEIHFMEDVPPRVAINEAVELAKTFGSESSGRFVNGVLGTVMQRAEGHTSMEKSGTQGTTKKWRRGNAHSVRTS